jgi:hypothetical protein
MACTTGFSCGAGAKARLRGLLLVQPKAVSFDKMDARQLTLFCAAVQEYGKGV